MTASLAQYVTMVANGGMPVRMANQYGAPYPTTGTGALVFNTGPVFNGGFGITGNLTVSGDITYGGNIIGADASPLTTRGDLYYFRTGNTRLPLGAAGTLLTSDGTDAAWTAPAPTPPTPLVGRRCLLMGDSLTQNCNTLGVFGALAWPGFNDSHQNDSWFSWANRLSGQRLYLNTSLNKGVAGQITSTILARFAADVLAHASEFDILFLMAGSNDAFQGLAVGPTIANIKTMVTQALAISKTVILMTPPPQGVASGIAAGDKVKLVAIGNALKEWAKNLPGVVVVDAYRAFIDPTAGTANNNYAPLFHGDGIHFSAGASYRLGQKIADAINVLLPPGPDVVASPADIYDATTNPNGNRVVNGCFTTTSGGTVTNGSGTIASGFIGARFAGSTWVNAEVVYSVVTTTQGVNAIAGNKQHIVVNIATGKAISESIQFTNFPAITTFVPGDEVIAEAEVDISGISNLWFATLQLTDSDGSQFPTPSNDGFDIYGVGSADLAKWDPQTYSGLVFRTPNYTIVKGTQVYIAMNFFFDGRTGATATIDLKGLTVRKIN